MYMRKENGKRESPYKGILKFADEKKPQLSLPFFNMCDKNLSDIEDAYESNAAASYGVERVFTPLNMTYRL